MKGFDKAGALDMVAEQNQKAVKGVTAGIIAEKKATPEPSGRSWAPAPKAEPKRFQLYTTPEIDAALREAAARTGKKVNTIINEILAAALLN